MVNHLIFLGQALLINSVLMGSPKLGLGSTAPSAATAKITVRGQSFENGGKVRFITLVATPSQKKYRQKLWVNAVTVSLKRKELKNVY